MNEHVRAGAVAGADFIAEAIAASSNLECEQSVIGAALVAPKLFHPLSEILKPEDFAEEVHQRVFACMLELSMQGKPITIMLVKGGMGGDVDLGGIPLSRYLARCASEAPVVQGAIELARTIRDLAMRRKLIEISADAIMSARSSALMTKTSILAAQVVSAMDEVASADLPKGLRQIALGSAAVRAIEASLAARDGVALRGLKTGLQDLDAMIGGMEPGQGSVLAGRPSMGKTAVALGLAMNVAKSGKGVFYVSLEMGDIPLASRSLASLCFDDVGVHPIPFFRISRGKLSNQEVCRCERAAEEMDRWPFLIEQQTELTVSQILARARQAKLQMEAKGIELGLVVIDHLGLIKSSNRYRGDRVREIGEISVNLHGLARELDVHVMMLSQLSRAIESREDKRPQLHDLRESGEIEQNADLVMGVFREAYYLERGAQNAETESRLAAVQSQLEIGVLKNRQGPTGHVHLFADMASNAIRGLK